MEMTWSDLCRSCLSSDTEIKITDGGDTVTLKQKFFEITTVAVDPNDGLPLKLCKQCYNAVNSAYEFRTQSIKMNGELRYQLDMFLKQQEEDNAKNAEESDTDDIANDPVKQLEAIIKTEQLDSDDDCYYVLVIDPKDQEKEKEVEQEAIEPPQIKVEDVHSTKEEEIIKMKQDSFDSSTEYFIISHKVPANVPATILENEEESQDNHEENFENTLTVENFRHLDEDAQNEETFIANLEDQEKNNKDNLITGDIVHSLPQSQGNFVKILTTTRPDGTIVLKSHDNITYLADAHLGTDDEDDDDPMSQEVIFCEGDDSSQFQIVKCDGNELVIEYADEGTIDTVLQQEDGTFLCECGQSFIDLTDYEAHQSTHTTSGDYLCTLCGKGFETPEILKGHNLLHNVTGVIVLCPFCNQMTKRNNLTQHIKYNHSSTKPQCNVCLKTFANHNNLKRHMMIHDGIKEFECDICAKRFNQKITMQTHRLTHVNPLACTQCDKVFTTSTALSEHKESNECDKSKILKVKDELMKNVKQQVTTQVGKVVGFACALCQKMFSVESALEQHVESMHLINPMELICAECGEVVPTKKEMQAHLQTHKTVKNKNSKRYSCSSCGKGCTSQAMLIMHERVHTNERPYSCQLCTLKFKTKTHLRTHQLTHTREKKFGCSVCMKFFALKGNLVVHLRTHTGERPYICNICGDAFIDSKYLKKHKQKKHAIEGNVPWNKY